VKQIRQYHKTLLPAEERCVIPHQTEGLPKHRPALDHIPPTAERCTPVSDFLHYSRHSATTVRDMLQVNLQNHNPNTNKFCVEPLQLKFM